MAEPKKTKKKIAKPALVKNPPLPRLWRIKKAVKKPAKKSAKTLPVKVVKKFVKKKVKKSVKPARLVKSAKVKAKSVVSKNLAAKKESERAQAAPPMAFKAKIRVIGIGGGGVSIVSEIGRSLGKASFVVADSDVRAFKKRPGIKNFLFGQQLTHGLGTGLNVELARQAAQAEEEKIKKLFEGQDIVIFIASLGGGLGSGATQVFAQAAKDFGGISFGIFTLPFKFEGKNKQTIALKALKQLRGWLNVSITIPNERIFKVIDASAAITDAFSMVNKGLIESLESLIELISSPGIINIDFADLRAILRGMGNFAFLNTAEAQGKDRAEKIIHDVLHNPLYQSNNFMAQKILFNIAGGGNLSMLEVNTISRAIFEKNPQAQIIFGISKNAKLKNKIKTTLLMTGLPEGFKEQGPVASKAVKKLVVAARKPAVKVSAVKVAFKARRRPKVKSAKKVVVKTAPPAALPSTQMPPAVMASAAVALAGALSEVGQEKKAIRRNALEAKKQEDLAEQQKTKQEEEWEIPAFLRLKK